jgi:dihydrofolate reductase
MAKLIFGMNVSLDGYVNHDHPGFMPDPELFRYFIAQSRNTAGSIYGRGLYELMRYWDGDAWDQDSREQGDLRAFAEAWRAMPKWVVSQSLKDVGPNATLIDGDFEAAVRKLKAEVEGEIEVGGPHLAASLTKLGLIDQYHLFLRPVVVGAAEGRPFFVGEYPRLRLIADERIGEDVIKLTYVAA